MGEWARELGLGFTDPVCVFVAVVWVLSEEFVARSREGVCYYVCGVL